jgi:ABC-type nitrate/sulfonate/bicarbonate transport system substrate-binding protein
MLLRKKGVDVGKIQFRNVGSNADIFKAVAAKTVDAGLGDVEVFDQQQKFGVHALPDGLLWKEIPEYTNQATYASEAAIAKDRDLLVRTLAAYDKAYRFVSGPSSKDAYLRARAAVTGSKDVQQATSQWSWIQKTQPYALDLVLSDDRINLVQKLNAEFKVQQKMLPMAQIADMSLARDALKIVR